MRLFVHPLLLLTVALAGGLLTGCGEQRADTAAISEEMRSRQLVHATPGQITEAARRLGHAATDTLAAAWRARVAAALARTTPDQALDACLLTSLPTYSALIARYQARVQRLAPRRFGPAPTLTPQVAGLLDAYLFGAAQGVPPEENIQRLDDNQTLLYTRPIVFDQPACLRCHGRPGTDVDAATQAALARRYPADTLHFDGQAGQLAGVWAVYLPRRQVILTLADD